jgi:hypothetical protein
MSALVFVDLMEGCHWLYRWGTRAIARRRLDADIPVPGPQTQRLVFVVRSYLIVWLRDSRIRLAASAAA